MIRLLAALLLLAVLPGLLTAGLPWRAWMQSQGIYECDCADDCAECVAGGMVKLSPIEEEPASCCGAPSVPEQELTQHKEGGPNWTSQCTCGSHAPAASLARTYLPPLPAAEKKGTEVLVKPIAFARPWPAPCQTQWQGAPQAPPPRLVNA
jgi:hypothetical protein